MAILRIWTAKVETTNRFTLAEQGEQYEQLSRFRSIDEVNRCLSNLGLVAWQIKDLWDGKNVELDSEHSWPHCG